MSVRHCHVFMLGAAFAAAFLTACTPDSVPMRSANTAAGGTASTQQASTSSTASAGGFGGAGGSSTASTGGMTSANGGAGGIGGMTSANGGAGGASSQGPAKLTDDGLVARYFLAEAAMGMSPPKAIDAAGEPLDLTIRYAPAMTSTPAQPHEQAMAYIESPAGNRGWSLPAVYSHGGAYASIAGTKIKSRLSDIKAATLECVARIDASAEKSSRLIHIGEGSGHAFGLETRDAGQVHFDFNERIVAATTILNELAQRIVIHAVVNTAAAKPEDRVRFYVNGVRRQAVQVGHALALDETLNLADTMSFVVANRLDIDLEGYARSIQGEVYYAAVYDQAMTESRIYTHYQRLALNDDPSAP